VAVVAVVLPGTASPPVRVAFPAWDLYIERFYGLSLRLENASSRPITGRLAAVAGSGLVVPAPEAVDVPAGGGVDVPMLFENRGARPGSVVMVAVQFEYELDGAPIVAVAADSFTVAGLREPTPDWRSVYVVAILLAGVVASGATLFLCRARPWRIRQSG
jgi:hypothetical protein